VNKGRQFFLYACAFGVLGLVFWAYTQPSFFLTMANQVWGCF
jgi:hypothetical protein